MAVNVTVRDIDNYPGNSKTVTVDLNQLVALGGGGDEVWLASASTTATASGSATIQPVYINENMLGWSKSTGFNQGPYTINASQNTLKVSIDGGTARTITLSNQDNPVTGEAVAADMQEKIQVLAVTGGLEAGNLSYKNATVEFSNGRFVIKSGAVNDSYTGTDRTSVAVTVGDSNNVATHLGFFAPIESYTIAGRSVKETYVAFQYTVSSGTVLAVNNGTVASTGDCIAVTDGTNTEYRYVSSAVASTITLNTAMSNSYAANSRVQVLREQDPASTPVSVFVTVDDAVRFALASITNQLDFS